MELTMSMFAKREHYLEAKCKQQEAALAELHAKVQKLERERDNYKRAYDEWTEKTEWVQQTAQSHELGMHRADVLRARIARAAAQPVPRYKIGYQTDQWGERSSTPGGIPDPAGDWVRYDDHVAALASAAQPGWPLLEHEAALHEDGAARFGPGVSAKLLVEAAYRNAERTKERQQMTLEQHQEEESKRRALWDMVRGAPAPAAQEDAVLLDWLRDNACDLRCIDMPTGGDDSEIDWVVIEHYMAKPQEREIGRAYKNDPRAAIYAARAAKEGDADAPR